MPSTTHGAQGSAIAMAIVVAAVIIGYSLPDAPRSPTYQAFVVEGKIVRLNTRNGNLIACDFERCVPVLGAGKKLVRDGNLGLMASTTVPEASPPEPTAPGIASASEN